MIMSEERQGDRLLRLEINQQRILGQELPSLQEKLDKLIEEHQQTRDQMRDLMRAAKAIGATVTVITGTLLWLWQQAKDFMFGGQQ